MLQIMNKLRQMCCHPSLALKGIDKVNNLEEIMIKVDQFFKNKANEI